MPTPPAAAEAAFSGRRRRSVDTILHGPPVNQHRRKPGMRARRGSFFGAPNLRSSGIFRPPGAPDDLDAERLARRLVGAGGKGVSQ